MIRKEELQKAEPQKRQKIRQEGWVMENEQKQNDKKSQKIKQKNMVENSVGNLQ